MAAAETDALSAILLLSGQAERGGEEAPAALDALRRIAAAAAPAPAAAKAGKTAGDSAKEGTAG